MHHILRGVGLSALMFCWVISTACHAQTSEKMTAEQFASYLLDELYVENADEIEELALDNTAQANRVISNLRRLPKLTALRFNKFEPSDSQLKQIIEIDRLTHIIFSGVESPQASRLSAAGKIKSIELWRCRDVKWSEMSPDRFPQLRKLSIGAMQLGNSDFGAIAGLEQVESLELADVSTQNSELAQLNGMRSLRALAVYNCGVDGGFLTEKGHFNELADFRFTGKLAPAAATSLARMTRLKTIEISTRVPLTASWFDSIAKNCPNLSRLVLTRQTADQAKLAGISKLTNLEHLELHADSAVPGLVDGISLKRVSFFGVPGCVSRLGPLTKLKVLRLSGRYALNAEDGAAICGLAQLRELELRRVLLGAGVFKHADKLGNLQTLSLYESSQLGNEDSKRLGALTSLRTLDLSKLSVLGAAFSNLKTLTKLRELKLVGLSSLSDSDMQMFSGMGELRSVDFEANRKVTDQGLAHLQHCSKLENVSMQHLEIDGSGFAAFPRDMQIRQLFISGTPINNRGFKAIARLDNLQLFALSSFSLEGDPIKIDLEPFRHAKSLKSVSILGTYYADEGEYQALMKQRPDLEFGCRTMKK